MSDLIYKRNRKRYLLLILPAFILYTFTLVIPLLGGTFPNALTNWNLMKGTKQFVRLDNYIHLLQDKNFQQAIVFTLILGRKNIALDILPPNIFSLRKKR